MRAIVQSVIVLRAPVVRLPHVALRAHDALHDALPPYPTGTGRFVWLMLDIAILIIRFISVLFPPLEIPGLFPGRVGSGRGDPNRPVMFESLFWPGPFRPVRVRTVFYKAT